MAPPAIVAAFAAAIEAAEATIGATAPNPPVGCAVLDRDGAILAVAAHPGAGQPHAEVMALRACAAAGRLAEAHALVVTLEPCNHHGRTPPCAGAIVAAGIGAVWVGIDDPNPRVAGGGIAALEAAGVRAHRMAELPEMAAQAAQCRALILPFATWARTGRPWVVVKRALDRTGSMIPPPGTKTFTSPASLRLAHLLRRQADAILTGIGTVLADAPEFTVRHVPDHPGKRRLLLVLDRHDRAPPAWRDAARRRGFDVAIAADIGAAIARAGAAGALTLLVEAGPTVTDAVLAVNLWDELVTIALAEDEDAPDRIERIRRDSAR